jgi:hypothetical protein
LRTNSLTASCEREAEARTLPAEYETLTACTPEATTIGQPESDTHDDDSKEFHFLHPLTTTLLTFSHPILPSFTDADRVPAIPAQEDERANVAAAAMILLLLLILLKNKHKKTPLKTQTPRACD